MNLFIFFIEEYHVILGAHSLKGRRIIDFIELWSIASSGGLEICVLSTSFQKNYINWPQQPPTEKVSDMSEK